jgi:ketosteroid isomerase-like protein
MERVDVVRDAWDAFNRRDLDAIVALTHPDIEAAVLPDLPDAQPFHGHDGVRRGLALNWEAWESMRVEVERVIESGDAVVALTRNHARGRGSGVEIVQRRGSVFGFRGDRIARVRFFADQAEALEAAGLSELPEHS